MLTNTIWVLCCYNLIGAKKKQLHVDRAEDDFATTGGYDDVDDYDFM